MRQLRFRGLGVWGFEGFRRLGDEAVGIEGFRVWRFKGLGVSGFGLGFRVKGLGVSGFGIFGVLVV